MGLAEELKHLITIRDSLLNKLAGLKSAEEATESLTSIVSIINQRIELILATLISEDATLKEDNVKKLQETKSNWFNELSRSILRAVVAHQLASRINLTEIFHVFLELLK